jgi:RND family efflux transporter MFP subunit
MKSTPSKVVALIVAASLGGAGVFALRLGNHHENNSAQMTASAMDGSSGDTSSKPKQLWTCGMHPQVIQDHPGTCPICHMKLTPLKDDSDDNSSGAAGGKRKILYFWDPMLGPSSIAHAPGKSAMGMDLVPVYEAEQSGGPTVKIDPTIVQNMGVRTAEVMRGPLAVTVRAVGMLEVPEPAVYEVNLKVNGWVQKLYANTEGMHIHKGEPLFDLYSPDVQVAEEELIGAVKALNGLDPKTADAIRAESQSMVDSAKQKLRRWGISDEDIDAISKASKAPPTIAFRSQADGDVVEKMVVEGSAVQAGMKLMRIEDHSKLWLNAQVYEDQIPAVALGQMVEAAVDGVPGKTFTGPIMFIYPHLDHMTRTVTVRVALDNPKHELRPGMYATANIVTKPLADALLVPREAVIDTGTQQIAFVAEPEGHFDPRKVRMGLAGDGDRVQILEGLAPGEMVVTSGQFLMDVESRTTEAIDKLRKAGTGTAMPDIESDGPTTMSAPVQTPSATMPSATIKSSAATHPSQLVLNFCPMQSAYWLQQVGEPLANPYLGSSMLTCGSVFGGVPVPAEGSFLEKVASAYIKIGSGLADDKIDAVAVEELKKATESISGGEYSELRQSINQMAVAPDVNSARIAFNRETVLLISLLKMPATK